MRHHSPEFAAQSHYPCFEDRADADPQSKTVTRILKEGRDGGEIVCTEPDWGEPSFSLAQEEWPSAVAVIVRAKPDW